MANKRKCNKTSFENFGCSTFFPSASEYFLYVFLLQKTGQFKILADFVNIYLQEVLIELSKVGKLALVRAGEQALDLTLTTKKLATNQPIDEVKEQVNEKYSS